MKKMILVMGVAMVFTGCVIKVDGEPKKQSETEMTISSNDNKQWIYEDPEKQQAKQEYCNLMYYTYKKCYGLGIQTGSTNTCVNSGAELAQDVSVRTNSEEMGLTMGKVCALACESANQNAGMASYQEFATKACP